MDVTLEVLGLLLWVAAVLLILTTIAYLGAHLSVPSLPDLFPEIPQ